MVKKANLILPRSKALLKPGARVAAGHALRRRRREVLASESALADNDFVELPAAPLAPTATRPAVVSLTLTRQALDGSVISISGALSEAQWRWALGLLRGRAHDSVDS